MFRMPLICRALTTSLLIFGLASATLFAGPVISFDPLAGGGAGAGDRPGWPYTDETGSVSADRRGGRCTI